ncbi:MAG: class IV adenylate cyclase [Desulfovibrio sp.]
MPLEKELKYLDGDHDHLRGILQKSPAEYVGKWFEENIVFDDADRSLKEHLLLLRLRRKADKYVLTVKKPPKADDPDAQSCLKVYEEYEVSVSDFEQTQAIFQALGYCPAFRYEKVREKWRINSVDVCLDLLPFGMFVEIEGEEENVLRTASLLGLKESSTDNYHTLNRNWRESQKLVEDDNFVFDESLKQQMLIELQKL